MLSMRIKLDKELIEKDGVYNYDELLVYLQDTIETMGAETWVDDYNYLHCDVYDWLYHPPCDEMGQIYLWLRTIDWFGRYCLRWGLISDYDLEYRKIKNGVYTEDLIANERSCNPLFTRGKSREELESYKPVDYRKGIFE